MCSTCGCESTDSIGYFLPEEVNLHQHSFQHLHTHKHGNEEHSHAHEHTYAHVHRHETPQHTHEGEENQHHAESHQHSHGLEIKIEQDVLQRNNLLAERNRGYFEAKNIFALNLVSSPGSGKTSLLEKTIKDLGAEMKIFVIEGDQQTMNDANRIQQAGAPVIQINTGNGCHLDSDMIHKAVKKLMPTDNSILMIENVGNLVCPALFDLGENKRVVVISVTEGEDKPIKYPAMFRSADVCVINKIDLLPYLDFDMNKMKNFALQVNKNLKFFDVSVKTGEGLNDWYSWLKTTVL